uniref:BESS domain-containing protein n=1 Tax=Timema cristinae TaxID=61476 RepID=A0A7R9GW66_TIMCR|nr:unnamed protein product [Timema cristinae]
MVALFYQLHNTPNTTGPTHPNVNNLSDCVPKTHHQEILTSNIQEKVILPTRGAVRITSRGAANKIFTPYLRDMEDPPVPERSVYASTSAHREVRKRRNLDDVNEQILKALEAREDPHLSFCKGILPAIKEFNEEDTLDFQMGVLKLIKSIKIKRLNPSSSLTNLPPHPFLHHSTPYYQTLPPLQIYQSPTQQFPRPDLPPELIPLHPQSTYPPLDPVSTISSKHKNGSFTITSRTAPIDFNNYYEIGHKGITGIGGKANTQVCKIRGPNVGYEPGHYDCESQWVPDCVTCVSVGVRATCVTLFVRLVRLRGCLKHTHNGLYMTYPLPFAPFVNSDVGPKMGQGIRMDKLQKQGQPSLTALATSDIEFINTMKEFIVDGNATCIDNLDNTYINVFYSSGLHLSIKIRFRREMKLFIEEELLSVEFSLSKRSNESEKGTLPLKSLPKASAANASSCVESARCPANADTLDT